MLGGMDNTYLPMHQILVKLNVSKAEVPNSNKNISLKKKKTATNYKQTFPESTEHEKKHEYEK
jgi:hypothetical protein